ncbi:MAG: TetR/AcrR family transcriptional regulator [Bacilli bacterium]|nr:TetR/AcrR family transcriptional regulator [Bacilli bacterium]
MNKRSDNALRAIYDAIFTLLETQTFDKITVRGICKAASVNKMTFYKYHTDKYDALAKAAHEKCTVEFIKLVGSKEEFFKRPDSSEACYFAAKYINDWVIQNGKVFHNLFSTPGGMAYDIVCTTLANDYYDFIKEVIKPEIHNVTPEYVANFYFYGILSCTEYYLRKLKTGRNKEELKQENDNACRFFAKNLVYALSTQKNGDK